MKKTLRERIIEERVGQGVAGTISVAADRLADGFAHEALADEPFRRAIREVARSCSLDLLKDLLARPHSRSSTRSRTRRKRESARP